MSQGKETRLWKELPRHRDEDQVQLDVNRAFVYYPNRKFFNASSCTASSRVIPTEFLDSRRIYVAFPSPFRRISGYCLALANRSS